MTKQTTLVLTEAELEAIKYAVSDIGEVYADDDDSEVRMMGEVLLSLQERLGWTAELTGKVPGVQVGISSTQEWVGTDAGIREALRAVGLPEGPFEEVDAEHGVYLVAIPTADYQTLESEGYMRWTGGSFTVEAEMP